jgi:hypothetical protein
MTIKKLDDLVAGERASGSGKRKTAGGEKKAKCHP